MFFTYAAGASSSLTGRVPCLLRDGHQDSVSSPSKNYQKNKTLVFKVLSCTTGRKVSLTVYIVYHLLGILSRLYANISSHSSAVMPVIMNSRSSALRRGMAT